MPILNSNVVVREGGFVDAMRYALENNTCFVMGLMEVPMDKSIAESSEILIRAAFKELDMSDEEFNDKLLKNTVSLNLGGFFFMSVEEMTDHINDATEDHEAMSVVFVNEPELAKALGPGVTLQ